MSRRAADLHAAASRADATASDAWGDMRALNADADWDVEAMLPDVATDRHRRVGE